MSRKNRRKKRKHLHAEEGASLKQIPVRHELVDWGGRWGIPEHWTDETIQCRACSRDFIFSAVTKRSWYEELGKGINVRPVYCSDCYHTYTVLRKAAADLETQQVHQMSTDRLEAAVKILTDLKGMQATINFALLAAMKKRLKQRDN